MLSKARPKQPSAQCAEHKGSYRDERGQDREARYPGQSECQEHDIAGHVGDEDVAKHHVAKRVDQTGDQRHADQQWRQRTMLDCTLRHKRLANFRDKGMHNKHSSHI